MMHKKYWGQERLTEKKNENLRNCEKKEVKGCERVCEREKGREWKRKRRREGKRARVRVGVGDWEKDIAGERHRGRKTSREKTEIERKIDRDT